MPVHGDRAEPPLVIPRLEHEPAVGFAFAQAEACLVALAPVLLISRGNAPLTQAPPVHRLRDDFPHLPGYALAVDVIAMRHGYAQCSYEASERERNICSAATSLSTRSTSLLLLGGTKLVEQQRDALDLTGCDRLTRCAPLELSQGRFEPEDGVGWFTEEDGKLHQEHPSHALPSDSLVHETSVLLKCDAHGHNDC